MREENALRRYRETVNHLQGLVEKMGREPMMSKVVPTPRGPVRERGGSR